MDPKTPLESVNAWIEEARQDGRLPKIVGVSAVVLVFAGLGLAKLLWSPAAMVRDTARTGVSWLGRHEKAEDFNEQRQQVLATGGRFQARRGDSTGMVLWGRKAKAQAAAGPGAAAAPGAAGSAAGDQEYDADDADDAPDPDMLPQALAEQEGRQPLMTSAPLSVPGADAGKSGPMVAAPAPAAPVDPAAAAAAAAAAKLQKAGERAYRAAAAGNTQAAGAIARTALRENRGLLRSAGVAVPQLPDQDTDPEAAEAAALTDVAPAIGHGPDAIRATVAPGGASGPLTQAPGAKPAPAATPNVVGSGGGGGGGGGSAAGSGSSSGDTTRVSRRTNGTTTTADPPAPAVDPQDPGATDPQPPVRHPRRHPPLVFSPTPAGSSGPGARLPRTKQSQ